MAVEVKDTINNNNARQYITPIPSNNSNVIDGYFVLEKNEEELLISRINAILCGIIGVLICAMLASYYLVSIKEIQFNKIRKDIITTRDENVELQNKLDSLTSYSNVDQMTKEKNLMQHSQQIIEIEADETPIKNTIKKIHKPSFKWSIGY